MLGVVDVLWVGGGRLVRWDWGLCACTGGDPELCQETGGGVGQGRDGCGGEPGVCGGWGPEG